MTADEVRQLIAARLPEARVRVNGGDGKFEAEVASDRFAGLGTVKAHRLVYATVAEEIASGAIHALSIRTSVPDPQGDRVASQPSQQEAP